MKRQVFGMTFVAVGLLLAQGLLALQPDDRNAYSTTYSTNEGSLNYRYTVNDRNNTPIVTFLAFEVDESQRQTIVEDAAILNHMISKGLPSSNSGSAMGVTVSRRASRPQALYVEGNGLILVHSVQFPVAPIEESADTGSGDEEPPSTEWDRARKSLQESTRSARQGILVQSVQVDNGLIMEYNPRRVDRLDASVRKALTQIGNFRDLAQDDRVTVFIYGTAPRREGKPMQSVVAWRARFGDIKSESADGALIEMVQRLEVDGSAPLVSNTVAIPGPISTSEE